MGLNAVAAYTQNLGVKAFKAGNIFLEGLEFAGSDRRKISKVKCKYHIFLSPVFQQLDRAFVRDGLK